MNRIVDEGSVPVVIIEHTNEISVEIIKEVDCINNSVETLSVGLVVELSSCNCSHGEDCLFRWIECYSVISFSAVSVSFWIISTCGITVWSNEIRFNIVSSTEETASESMETNTILSMESSLDLVHTVLIVITSCLLVKKFKLSDLIMG